MIINGNSLNIPLADNSVQCCVTSPPYFGLRDYGIDGQLGLEQTPAEYVANMVAVFREVWRVLRPDGTLFLNLGDSFSGSKIFSESYRIREDLTNQEKNYVAMEMFGVRVDGNQEAGAGSMRQVLPQEICHSQAKTGFAIQSERSEGILRTQQGERPNQDETESARIEMGSDRETGREVCLLRGNGNGISDSGSHQQRWGGASQGTNGIEPSQFGQDSQGYSQSGIPEGQIPGSVLQLQLFNRVLGVLSTHTYSEHEIPDSCRFAFAKRVALKPKDLIGIPWRVAFALQADGWYLRSDIIWSKPNPMPESVTDRPTRAHEYIFLMAKQERYYYDHEAIKEPATFYDPRLDNPNWQPARKDRDQIGAPSRGGGPLNNRSKRDSFKRDDSKRAEVIPGQAFGTHRPDREESGYDIGSRNKRSVWSVATHPYKGAHFATFPPKLIEPCILAGSRPGDIVFDPFNGAGTTGMVALKHNRKYIGIELNPEYIKLTERRLETIQPVLV